MSEELVVLVDENGADQVSPQGEARTMGKREAHVRGQRHRAVSIFIMRDQELLLQRRAADKYHSGGLWTNTCCTHPRLGETASHTAHRRLAEEMGMECELQEIMTFSYVANVGNGLVENEFDHVFVGRCQEDPQPDKEEVGSWKWISVTELKDDIVARPELYTTWLRHCFEDVVVKIG